jgi:hypothetical protein
MYGQKFPRGYFITLNVESRLSRSWSSVLYWAFVLDLSHAQKMATNIEHPLPSINQTGYTQYQTDNA